jgi:hypothetical protein
VATLEAKNADVFGGAPAELLRQPTPGALQLAFQRGLITLDQFTAKLQAQGYTQDAIEIFRINAQYQAPTDPKQPTRADLSKWLREGIITRSEFARRLTELGYLATDIELYLRAESPSLGDTDLAAFFEAGILRGSWRPPRAATRRSRSKSTSHLCEVRL